jgi:hypothetical protein
MLVDEACRCSEAVEARLYPFDEHRQRALTGRSGALRANQPRSKRACSSAVRSAVGTASSRSSGMSSPLSMERP